MQTDNSLHLHNLKALYMQWFKSSLCKQKHFVYQTGLFKTLYYVLSQKENINVLMI